MTDLPGDPRRPDDELVSAVLDGEATPDERARVEADPVLRARLDEFAAVRDRVAAPVTPRPEADRDAAIAAAVAEAAERREREAKVVQLRRRQAVPRFLAAAAAVLLVVGGFGYLATQLDSADDSGDEASGGDAAALEATDDTAAAGEAESFEDAAGGGSDGSEAATAEGDLALPPPLSLPPVADEDELTAVLRAEELDPAPDDGFSEAPPPSSVLPPAELDTRGSSLECQQALETTNPALSGLLVKATTDFAGVPAVVYVYGGASGDRRVIVVTDEACTPLADFQL